MFSSKYSTQYRTPLKILPEIVNSVEGYGASLNKDQIITVVNDILPKVQAYIESDGGAFEYKM